MKKGAMAPFFVEQGHTMSHDGLRILFNTPNPKTLWVIPLLLSFLFNLNVLGNGYGWDDELIIGTLHSPRDPVQLFLPRLKEPGYSPNPSSYYRPLVSVSYQLDYALWGETPSGFHLSVLLGHCINTMLVFFLTGLLLSGPPSFRGSGWIPLVAASGFAVHPVHAEAVAWIAGRSDVFCTLFVLMTMIFYLHSVRSGKKIFYAMSMVFFLLALFTKETAIGLVFLFPVYDFLTSPGSRLKLSRMGGRALAPLGILMVYFWMRYVPSGLHSPYSTPSPGPSFYSAFWEGIQALGFYLRLLVLPFPVLPFIQELPVSPGYLFGTGLIAFGLLAWTVFVFLQRLTVPVFGLAWTAFLLIPPIAVSVFDLATTEAAERYLYTPSVGFLIAVSWLVMKGAGEGYSRLNGFSRGATISATALGIALLTGFMGWVSLERNRIWHSTETFWKQAALSSPEFGQPHRELGIIHQKKRAFAEAESHFLRALELDRKSYGFGHPETGKDVNSLALLYDGQKRYGEAAPLYQEALVIVERAFGADHPSAAFILNNLAGIHRNEGQYGLAEPLLLRAIKIREKVYGPGHPSLGSSFHNLARLYYMDGRYESAEPFFLKAGEVRTRALGPNHLLTIKTYAGLAELYQAQGRHSEARGILVRTLPLAENLLGPDNPLVASAQFSLGESYRMEGRFSEALPLYKRALEIQEKHWGSSNENLISTLEPYLEALKKAGRMGEAEGVEERLGKLKEGKIKVGMISLKQ